MLQRKNATTRAFFSAALPAQREAVQAAETLAATFAENPKLKGMTIVVTDDYNNSYGRNVPIPDLSRCKKLGKLTRSLRQLAIAARGARRDRGRRRS